MGRQNVFVAEFLKAMKVEYTYEQEEGFKSLTSKPILLSEQKKVLLIMNNFTHNFDKETADGYFQQKMQLTQLQHPECQVIQLNLDKMNQLSSSPLDIVNYLIDQGVESNVTSDYDFSQITQTENKYREKSKVVAKEKEEEEEPAIAKDSSSDSSSSDSEENWSAPPLKE